MKPSFYSNAVLLFMTSSAAYAIDSTGMLPVQSNTSGTLQNSNLVQQGEAATTSTRVWGNTNVSTTTISYPANPTATTQPVYPASCLAPAQTINVQYSQLEQVVQIGTVYTWINTPGCSDCCCCGTAIWPSICVSGSTAFGCTCGHNGYMGNVPIYGWAPGPEGISQITCGTPGWVQGPTQTFGKNKTTTAAPPSVIEFTTGGPQGGVVSGVVNSVSNALSAAIADLF